MSNMLSSNHNELNFPLPGDLNYWDLDAALNLSYDTNNHYNNNNNNSDNYQQQHHRNLPSELSLGWGSFLPHKTFQDLDFQNQQHQKFSSSSDLNHLDLPMDLPMDLVMDSPTNSSDQTHSLSLPSDHSMEFQSALTQSLARNALEAASHLYMNQNHNLSHEQNNENNLCFLNPYSMYRPPTPEDNLDSHDNHHWLSLQQEFNLGTPFPPTNPMVGYSHQHQLIGLPGKTDLGPWVRVPRQKPTLLSQDPTQPLLYCKFCHQPFSRRNSLRRHELLHTGVKPYVCTPCGRSFSRQDIFKRHCASRRCQRLTLSYPGSTSPQ